MRPCVGFNKSDDWIWCVCSAKCRIFNGPIANRNRTANEWQIGHHIEQLFQFTSEYNGHKKWHMPQWYIYCEYFTGEYCWSVSWALRIAFFIMRYLINSMFSVYGIQLWCIIIGRSNSVDWWYNYWKFIVYTRRSDVILEWSIWSGFHTDPNTACARDQSKRYNV